MSAREALGRWSNFLDSPMSIAVSTLLAASHTLRLPPQKIAIPLRLKGHDRPVFCRPGTSDFHTLLQIWDQGEYSVAQRFATHPVQRILDLGSNIGLSVRYFSQIWPTAQIVGVEPDEGNHEIARTNLSSLIASGQVGLHRCFVGVDAGFANVRRPAGLGSNELRIGDPVSRDSIDAVPVRTVPELIKVFGDESIDLLKCDIEGHERVLFDNGPGWLRRVRALVVELHGIEPEWLWRSIGAAGVDIVDRKVQPIPGYDLSLAWARLAVTQESPG